MNVCWLRPNCGWRGDVWLYLSFSDCAAVRSSAVRHRRLSQCLFPFLKLCQTLLFLTSLCSEIFCIYHCWLQIGVWAHQAQLKPAQQTDVVTCLWTGQTDMDMHFWTLFEKSFLAIQQHIFLVRNGTKPACVPTCCMNMLNISLSQGSLEKRR